MNSCATFVGRSQAAGYATGTMTLAGYKVLRERLGSIAGRAILTVNDHPALRELFSGWGCEEVEIRHTVSGGAGRQAKELIYRTW